MALYSLGLGSRDLTMEGNNLARRSLGNSRIVIMKFTYQGERDLWRGGEAVALATVL